MIQPRCLVLFDGIEYRGFKQEDVEDLAKYSGVPVWNGLTDTWHPTQMIADFMTLKERFGSLEGLIIAYIEMVEIIWPTHFWSLRLF